MKVRKNSTLIQPKKLKHRMPVRNKVNISNMINIIETWENKEYREKSLNFAKEIGPKNLFEILHGMRRWYSGQTMARLLKSKRKYLKKVMKLNPENAVGVYRGFKVNLDNSLANHIEGDILKIKVTRNHGFSSWTLEEAPAHKFAGKTKDKVAFIIKLISKENVVPILAPPQYTKKWFNALYERIIGKSFRIKEKEYLIYGSPLKVKIIKRKD